MDKQIKKNEKWFRTNLDFEETRRKLKEHEFLFKGNSEGVKGRITFQLKDEAFENYSFQFTNRGKLGIYYPDGYSPEFGLEKIKPFLITAEGSQAEIYDVIKDTEEFPQVSPYVNHPENFRLYREIFEDLVNILRRKGPNLKSYLDLQCKYCEKNLSEPPAIPQLCKDCYGSLYSIAIDKLADYIPKKVPNHIIAIFLIYEYKAHILMLACDEIRRAYRELKDDDFAVLFESLRQRVRRLEDFDASLEPKIPDYVFFVLLIAPPKDAEKALRLAIEAVKWHIIRENLAAPNINKKFDQAYNEFVNEGMLIINKTLHSMPIKDFNRKVKRASFILGKRESAGKKFP